MVMSHACGSFRWQVLKFTNQGAPETMASRRKNRMTVHDRDGVAVMDLGEMDIWDGADLALLRETLTKLIEVEEHTSIGVDLTHVKYIPSGFFGMLFDWHERGIEFRLYNPQPNVSQMLWFRQFLEHQGEGCYLLLSEPQQALVPIDRPDWHVAVCWEEQDERREEQTATASSRK